MVVTVLTVLMQVKCKNKREGKQLAAQAILKLMHPQLTMWGSLLRLYSKSNEIKERKVSDTENLYHCCNIVGENLLCCVDNVTIHESLPLL